MPGDNMSPEFTRPSKPFVTPKRTWGISEIDELRIRLGAEFDKMMGKGLPRNEEADLPDQSSTDETSDSA